MINKIIENAINKVKLFESSSLIKEKADVFIKIHLVPMDQLIKIEGGVVIPNTYMVDLALIGPSVVRIKDYLNMHEDGSLTLGRRMDRVRSKKQLTINYIDLMLRTLRFFDNYFVCRHVLDHIAWAYDEVMNSSSVIKLFKDEFRDDKEVDKALNELSKHMVTVITAFYNGLRRWVLNNKLKKPSYTQYFMINEVLKRLAVNEYLAVIEVDEDYYYLGLLKDVPLIDTVVKLG